MDLQAIEAFFKQFGQTLSASDYEKVTRITEEYLTSENYHAHVGLAIASNLAFHKPMLDLARKVIKKSIQNNTIEHLAKFMPEMGNVHYQTVEFGRLYSQYAWILWKQEAPEEALSEIQKAMEYINQAGSPPAEACLRYGIILSGNGEEHQGWQQISQALLMDTQIEKQDPGYMAAIAKLIHKRQGPNTDPEDFLTQYRYQHAEQVPDTVFKTLEGDRIRLDQQRGNVLFVSFFSPLCGSCQQEIPSLKTWHDALRSHPNLAIYFVLNQPRMQKEAVEMFKRANLSNPVILTVEKGSAYDLISEEPTVWIVGKSGKILSKHTGYLPGDESVYHQELTHLLKQ